MHRIDPDPDAFALRLHAAERWASRWPAAQKSQCVVLYDVPFASVVASAGENNHFIYKVFAPFECYSIRLFGSLRYAEVLAAQ